MGLCQLPHGVLLFGYYFHTSQGGPWERTINTSGVCGVEHGLHFSRDMNSAIRKFSLCAVLALTTLAFASASQANAAFSFDPATNFAAGTGSFSVATGDVNGDGKRDLAVANYATNDVSVLLGNGIGGFGAATNFSAGTNPTSVAMGDFNGDGKLDLAVASFGSTHLAVLLGDGTGSFGPTTLSPVSGAPGSVAVGDVNNDGKADLVAAIKFAPPGPGPTGIAVLLGNGVGGFGPATTFPVGGSPTAVEIGDLNADGNPDVVGVDNAGRISVLLGNGAGSFATSLIVVGGVPTSVAIGDLNGDGKPDLAVARSSANDLAVLLGNGDGTFGAPNTFATGTSPQSVVIADLDGDGKRDLVTANISSNNVSVLLGTGSGSFGAQQSFSITSGPIEVTVADLNGDGRPDITAAANGSGNASVLLNTTDITAPDTIIDTATPASPANTGVRTFTFHGVDPAPATPPITFECRIDGGAWFACSSGYATPNLADGNHTVDIRAKDAAGNVDATPASSSWVVDKTPPNTIIDTATPASPTQNSVRTFTFHGEDPPPGTALTLECRLDGVAWFSCTSPHATGSLPEGQHTFEVRATDAAGNVDATPATSTWVIDQTKPDITITKPAMRERFTLDQHVPSNFSCVDPPVIPPPVVSGINTCTGPSTVDTSQLGNFRFVVNASDNAGNTHQVVHSYAVDPPKYADVINANNPIAYYRLGDPLGSDQMADSSGNNRNGEFKNGIALRRPPAPSCHVRPHAPYTCDLNADPQDWSAFFPARDGYGFTNGITAPTTAYTWEAWINRADHGDGMIGAHGGGGQLFVKDGRLALRQTQDTVHSAGPVLTPGEWFHVAGTWNGTTTRLYVNGVQVGFSNSANKAPSGTSTLYVGYGDQAPWFHGSIDEAAYFGSALSGSALRKRYVVGTAKDVPSPIGGPPIQRPSADIASPANNGLYAVTKLPPLDFSCDDLDGLATVASCTATVDGNPVLNGAALPDTPGPHPVVVTAVDDDGLTRSHTHTYTIKSFEDIYNTDSPIAYYRLGDATGDPMKDSGPQGRHGTYKNDQESGPIGISGDLDHARKFFGAGGYGFVSSIPAPTFQSTIEAWVNPDDHRNQSVVGHGDAGEIYIQDGLFVFKHMGTSVTSHIGPTPGQFTQVVGVWDGVTISIYVNGELHGQEEATKRPSSSSTFYVGYGEIRPWFKGSLDEVAYYGKALTPGRVLEHFLADPPPPNDEPVVSDPGEDPETPVIDDPDDPVSNPDPDERPKPGVKPDDNPSVGPGDGSDGSAESGTGAKKNSKAGKRKAALKKCSKIKKKSKRKACKKRAYRLG